MTGRRDVGGSRLAAIGATAAMIVGLGAIVGDAGSAHAQASGCEQTDDQGGCVVQIPVDVPGTPTGGGGGGGNGGGGGPSGPPPACVWQTVARPRPTSLAAYPDAPPDAIWQALWCGPGSENSGRGFRWVSPGGAGTEVTPPPPAVVAQTLLATVEAQMQAPALASDPAPGVSAVVKAPVFVEVTNWQGPINAGPECVFFVCVSMTATPTLSFDPGDGSPAITCDPPGSRYLPGGPPLVDQAVGACAHTYRKRTGVEGRPGEWPGSVTVTWDVAWTSSVAGTPGPSGSFDPLVFTTGLPRAVEEVATVVVDGES